MKKLLCLLAALAALFFCACDTGVTGGEEEEEEALVEAPESLAGTYWFWPSLALFFVSEDRVVLFSVGGYYPYPDHPFPYTYPAPGYAYSYTWNPQKRNGSVKDLGEYTGGDLGAYRISGDMQTLKFAIYKSYGHSADFITLRPRATNGYGAMTPLPSPPAAAALDGTVWVGTSPGITPETVPGGQGYLITLYFTENSVYVTRTWDIDKSNTADTQRLFDFTVSGDGSGGEIIGVGVFTFNAAKNVIHFDNFPRPSVSVDFERIK
jgi:hypothetical protein